MATAPPESTTQAPPRRREAHTLATTLLAALDGHTAVTDGRSYLTKAQAQSRQRAFIYALRGHPARGIPPHAGSDGVHTHVRQASDGRWRVYATRVHAYPA